jgi:hypothetical protein
LTDHNDIAIDDLHLPEQIETLGEMFSRIVVSNENFSAIEAPYQELGEIRERYAWTRAEQV